MTMIKKSLNKTRKHQVQGCHLFTSLFPEARHSRSVCQY